MEAIYSSETSAFTGLLGIISQMIQLSIGTAVRSSHPAYLEECFTGETSLVLYQAAGTLSHNE
jgi:hypothetical protein